MQRHQFRSEQWIVTQGRAIVNRQMASGYNLPSIELKMHDTVNIAVADWHQLTNPFKEPCRIVEIQYGEQCLEEDIERL
jgi:mannose-6-phosphate isomerase-like protein (cupin superfamily)